MPVAHTQVKDFAELVRTRTARIGIIGLGYAGLPLAASFAEAGFDVVGIDVSAQRVDAVNARRSYLVDVPAERYEGIEDRLQATTDYAVASELDAITICVPTPLSKTQTPDMSFILSATESLAEHLRPGQLIVLQSTTSPGTTKEIVLPILARGGAVVGEDFFLGYAPERVNPGVSDYTIRTTPKLVSGVTSECLARTTTLYEQVIDTVIATSSPIVAETAKLHENTFRAVNIALANELALMCHRMGVSAWEVIDAAASKPFGFLAHYPGPGLGGDCIPVVPHFLAHRLREYGYSAQLIGAAHEINAQMPTFVLQRIADALNESSRAIKGSRILLLGMAYKANVQDTRESPSLEVLRQLRLRGATVRYCDPHVESFVLDGEVWERVAFSPEELGAADCVVMLTAHDEFLGAHWDGVSMLVDTRNVVPAGPRVRTL
jgi:UDP-N-acetyl-D-glucosamine dehydrogenase